MFIKDNITLAYELALKTYKDKSFTFLQIWKDLVKKYKFDKNEQKNIAQFYMDLLQDKRFIFIGNKKWKIREFLKHEEVVKLENALYDFEQDSVDEISSSEEKLDDTYTDEDNKIGQSGKQEKIDILDTVEGESSLNDDSNKY